MDQYGHIKQKWYSAYSTEWTSTETITSKIKSVMKDVQVHMDNSIMPWINNQTLKEKIWSGTIRGVNLDADTAGNHGT